MDPFDNTEVNFNFDAGILGEKINSDATTNEAEDFLIQELFMSAIPTNYNALGFENEQLLDDQLNHSSTLQDVTESEVEKNFQVMDMHKEITPQPAAMVEELTLKIGKVEQEKRELQDIVQKQERELAAYEERIGEIMTESLKIILERDTLKENLEANEKAKANLEIKYNEKQAELIQFKELVHNNSVDAKEIVKLTSQMNHFKEIHNKKAVDLLKVTNVLNAKRKAFRKLKASNSQLKGIVLQFGETLKEKGSLTLKQLNYLKDFENKHGTNIASSETSDEINDENTSEIKENNYYENSDIGYNNVCYSSVAVKQEIDTSYENVHNLLNRKAVGTNYNCSGLAAFHNDLKDIPFNKSLNTCNEFENPTSYFSSNGEELYAHDNLPFSKDSNSSTIIKEESNASYDRKIHNTSPIRGLHIASPNFLLIGSKAESVCSEDYMDLTNEDVTSLIREVSMKNDDLLSPLPRSPSPPECLSSIEHATEAENQSSQKKINLPSQTFSPNANSSSKYVDRRNMLHHQISKGFEPHISEPHSGANVPLTSSTADSEFTAKLTLPSHFFHRSSEKINNKNIGNVHIDLCCNGQNETSMCEVTPNNHQLCLNKSESTNNQSNCSEFHHIVGRMNLFLSFSESHSPRLPLVASNNNCKCSPTVTANSTENNHCIPTDIQEHEESNICIHNPSKFRKDTGSLADHVTPEKIADKYVHTRTRKNNNSLKAMSDTDDNQSLVSSSCDLFTPKERKSPKSNSELHIGSSIEKFKNTFELSSPLKSDKENTLNEINRYRKLKINEEKTSFDTPCFVSISKQSVSESPALESEFSISVSPDHSNKHSDPLLGTAVTQNKIQSENSSLITLSSKVKNLSGTTVHDKLNISKEISERKKNPMEKDIDKHGSLLETSTTPYNYKQGTTNSVSSSLLAGNLLHTSEETSGDIVQFPVNKVICSTNIESNNITLYNTTNSNTKKNKSKRKRKLQTLQSGSKENSVPLTLSADEMHVKKGSKTTLITLSDIPKKLINSKCSVLNKSIETKKIITKKDIDKCDSYLETDTSSVQVNTSLLENRENENSINSLSTFTSSLHTSKESNIDIDNSSHPNKKISSDKNLSLITLLDMPKNLVKIESPVHNIPNELTVGCETKNIILQEDIENCNSPLETSVPGIQDKTALLGNHYEIENTVSSALASNSLLHISKQNKIALKQLPPTDEKNSFANDQSVNDALDNINVKAKKKKIKLKKLPKLQISGTKKLSSFCMSDKINVLKKSDISLIPMSKKLVKTKPTLFEVSNEYTETPEIKEFTTVKNTEKHSYSETSLNSLQLQTLQCKNDLSSDSASSSLTHSSLMLVSKETNIAVDPLIPGNKNVCSFVDQSVNNSLDITTIKSSGEGKKNELNYHKKLQVDQKISKENLLSTDQSKSYSLITLLNMRSNMYKCEHTVFNLSNCSDTTEIKKFNSNVETNTSNAPLYEDSGFKISSSATPSSLYTDKEIIETDKFPPDKEIIPANDHSSASTHGITKHICMTEEENEIKHEKKLQAFQINNTESSVSSIINEMLVKKQSENSSIIDQSDTLNLPKNDSPNLISSNLTSIPKIIKITGNKDIRKHDFYMDTNINIQKLTSPSTLLYADKQTNLASEQFSTDKNIICANSQINSDNYTFNSFQKSKEKVKHDKKLQDILVNNQENLISPLSELNARHVEKQSENSSLITQLTMTKDLVKREPMLCNISDVSTEAHELNKIATKQGIGKCDSILDTYVPLCENIYETEDSFFSPLTSSSALAIDKETNIAINQLCSDKNTISTNSLSSSEIIDISSINYAVKNKNKQHRKYKEFQSNNASISVSSTEIEVPNMITSKESNTAENENLYFEEQTSKKKIKLSSTLLNNSRCVRRTTNELTSKVVCKTNCNKSSASKTIENNNLYKTKSQFSNGSCAKIVNVGKILTVKKKRGRKKKQNKKCGLQNLNRANFKHEHKKVTTVVQSLPKIEYANGFKEFGSKQPFQNDEIKSCHVASGNKQHNHKFYNSIQPDEQLKHSKELTNLKPSCKQKESMSDLNSPPISIITNPSQNKNKSSSKNSFHVQADIHCDIIKEPPKHQFSKPFDENFVSVSPKSRSDPNNISLPPLSGLFFSNKNQKFESLECNINFHNETVAQSVENGSQDILSSIKSPTKMKKSQGNLPNNNYNIPSNDEVCSPQNPESLEKYHNPFKITNFNHNFTPNQNIIKDTCSSGICNSHGVYNEPNMHTNVEIPIQNDRQTVNENHSSYQNNIKSDDEQTDEKISVSQEDNVETKMYPNNTVSNKSEIASRILQSDKASATKDSYIKLCNDTSLSFQNGLPCIISPIKSPAKKENSLLNMPTNTGNKNYKKTPTNNVYSFNHVVCRKSHSPLKISTLDLGSIPKQNSLDSYKNFTNGACSSSPLASHADSNVQINNKPIINKNSNLTTNVRRISYQHSISDDEHLLVIAEDAKEEICIKQKDTAEFGMSTNEISYNRPLHKNKRRKKKFKNSAGNLQKKPKIVKNEFVDGPVSIPKALEELEKLKFDESHFKLRVHTLVNAFINPTNASDTASLLIQIIQQLSSSRRNPLMSFSFNHDISVLFPKLEKCLIVSLIEVEIKKKSHLKSLLSSAVNTLYLLVVAKDNIPIYGLCAFCRVLTQICKLTENRKKPYMLCCDLLKMQHKFAPYLIASIIGVWTDLFAISDSTSDEELLLQSTIAYAVEKKPKTLTATQWKHCSSIFSTFLASPAVSDVTKTAAKITGMIQSVLEEPSENDYMLTEPLVIFASTEDCKWTQQNLLANFIMPALVEYSMNVRNERAFTLFCELFCEIGLVFEDCSKHKEILSGYFFLDGVNDYVKSAAACSVIKLYILKNLFIPRYLYKWIEESQDILIKASFELLLHRRLISDTTEITEENIVL